jgi:hypothetical protein
MADTSVRQQRVSCNSAHSEWRDVVSGVPQGSVLRPVLFLIFISDLPNVSTGCVTIFADNTNIFNAVQDEENCMELQHDLDQLCDWSDTWKLKCNAGKCKVLHIGRHYLIFNYTMQESDGRFFCSAGHRRVTSMSDFSDQPKIRKTDEKVCIKGKQNGRPH